MTFSSRADDTNDIYLMIRVCDGEVALKNRKWNAIKYEWYAQLHRTLPVLKRKLFYWLIDTGMCHSLMYRWLLWALRRRFFTLMDWLFCFDLFVYEKPKKNRPILLRFSFNFERKTKDFYCAHLFVQRNMRIEEQTLFMCESNQLRWVCLHTSHCRAMSFKDVVSSLSY